MNDYLEKKVLHFVDGERFAELRRDLQELMESDAKKRAETNREVSKSRCTTLIQQSL
jgi:hypothetical protein